MKYLDQVRNAPESVFDFYPFLKKVRSDSRASQTRLIMRE